MLLPKYIIGISLFLGLFAPLSEANAGLYGFDSINPYTEEENILHMAYLPEKIINYRNEMRNNLLMLIDYAHSQNPDFQIISHEGQDLLTKSRWEYALEGYNKVRLQKISIDDPYFLFNQNISLLPTIEGSPEHRYQNAVDSIVINNLYCGKGYEQDYTFNNNIGHITIEHCQTEDALDRAVARSLLDEKAIFAFTNKSLAFSDIKSQLLINDSARNIKKVSQAKNISFLLDDHLYDTAEDMIKAISDTNYDVVIIKPIFQNSYPFTKEDIKRLSLKKNGAQRLIIALLNVSEASYKDYFWNPHWKLGNPSWLIRESFVSPNTYITQYWNEEWKTIISNYFKDIVTTGYSGVFFTGIENHQYFEHQTPLE